MAQMQRFQESPHHNAHRYVLIPSSCATEPSLVYTRRMPFIAIFSLVDGLLFETLGSEFCFCTLATASKYYYREVLVKVTAAIYSTLCSDMDDNEDCLSFMPLIMDSLDRSPGRFLMYQRLLHGLPLSSDLVWQFRISLLRQFRNLLNTCLRIRQRRAWVRDVW